MSSTSCSRPVARTLVVERSSEVASAPGFQQHPPGTAVTAWSAGDMPVGCFEPSTKDGLARRSAAEQQVGAISWRWWCVSVICVLRVSCSRREPDGQRHISQDVGFQSSTPFSKVIVATSQRRFHSDGQDEGSHGDVANHDRHPIALDGDPLHVG